MVILMLRRAFGLAWLASAYAFQPILPEVSRNRCVVTSLGAKSKSKTPEYIVQDEEPDEIVSAVVQCDGGRLSDDKPSEILLSAPNPVAEYIGESDTSSTTTTTTTQQQDKVSSQQQPQNLQYAALPPGTVVQIQVGDMGLARKAWKKRRRSGSPLLVPCSVLNVDRASTVRWNLVYLLEKFGRAAAGSKGGGGGGIRLSLAQLTQRYRSHLKTNLAQQATALGFDNVKDLVQALFNERVQKSYGIDVIIDDDNDDEQNGSDDGEIFLQAPVSCLRAQKRADRSPVLQVADDYSEDTLQHTGVVRTRRSNDDAELKKNLYQLQPLSAALRVNQKEDVDPGSIQTGSLHTAVVFDYDVAGDAGSPMITLTLNAAPRERLRFGPDTNNNHRRNNIIRQPKYMLKDLKIGDGPIKGKVMRFIKGGVWIDCGIGRRVGNRPESDAVRVLGLLKFNEAVVEESGTGSATQIKWADKDEVSPEEEAEWENILSFDELEVGEDGNDDDENDDENESDEAEGADLSSLFDFDDADEDGEVEDITHLFAYESDGSLTFTDPDTGEVQHISMDSLDDEDDEEDVEEDSDSNEDETLIDVFAKMESDEESDEEDEGEDGPVVLNQPSPTPQEFRSKRLHLGDEVEVFVKSVAKQSNQLFFTMKSSIKGKKPKDIKQESGKEKKLRRLLKQVGGMRRIRELRGREMDGIVKAASHTGDWLYVEPQEESLPVGIAFSAEGSAKGLVKGDTVRIQLEGIDESRGQLSMKVLNKLSP